MSVCNMDCRNCIYDDCINDSEVLSLAERKMSKDIDTDIIVSRGLIYCSTLHKRQNKDVDPVLYRQAQNRHFHQKYYKVNSEYYKKKGRENYLKHREDRLEQSHKYYQDHKEEILANKKSYYLDNRENILAKRKEKYIPKDKKPLIDTLEAEIKRQREKERYQKNKEEINRKRRERRKQKLENSENQ